MLRFKLGQVGDTSTLRELGVNECNLETEFLKQHGEEVAVAAGRGEHD